MNIGIIIHSKKSIYILHKYDIYPRGWKQYQEWYRLLFKLPQTNAGYEKKVEIG